MQEKVYVMTFADAQVSGAKSLLQSYGSSVITAFMNMTFDAYYGERFKNAQVVVVVVAHPAPKLDGTPNKFPNSCLRLLPNLGEALGNGFTVPDEILKFLNGRDASFVAIRASLCPAQDGLDYKPAVQTHPRLAEALEHMHYRDGPHGPWRKPKNREQAKADWRVRLNQRRTLRHQERRQEYMFA
jgi:hypothetical protein